MSWYSSTENQRYRSRTSSGDRRIALDERDRQFQHVLEIDPAGARLRGLVTPVQAGHQVGWERPVAIVGDRPRLVLSGADPAGLRPFDLARQVAHREVAISARQALGERGEDRRLRVEDRRRIRPVDLGPEVTELPERGGVERRRRHARLSEGRETSAHLARRLVRERDDEHVACPDDLGRECICDASRDDPGLAAPGSGEDAQRPGRDRDGLALGGIEVGQEVVGVADWHRAIVAANAAPAIIRWPTAGRSTAP